MNKSAFRRTDRSTEFLSTISEQFPLFNLSLNALKATEIGHLVRGIYICECVQDRLTIREIAFNECYATESIENGYHVGFKRY